MIRLFLRRGLLGDDIQRADLPDGTLTTPREILTAFSSRLPKSVPVQIAVDGELVTEDRMDDELRDGQQVIVLPVTHGEALVGFLVNVLIYIVASVATYYIMQALAPRPKAPGVPQERGEEGSQTYAWDGIKTNYGPGLPIPWCYGFHALGGQGIWTDTHASRASGQSSIDDHLRLILSLCEGPVHSIGGKQGNIDGMGGFAGGTAGPTIPAGITINGNLLDPSQGLPGARVSIRAGSQDQPPLNAPFTGVRQTFTLNQELPGIVPNSTVVFTFPDPVAINYIAIVLYFPAGLYNQLPTGQIVSASIFGFFRIRQVGSSTWSSVNIITTTGTSLGAHANTITSETTVPGLGIPPGTVGPIEIEITRNLIAPLPQGAVTTTIIRDIVVGSPHTLRYPLESLLALDLIAGSRFSGGLPNVTVPVKGALVRVWDATNGWSPRCWDVPAAPFNFHTYPPGRNPAWCLLDFLLARWGLGSYLTEADIDLPAFRRWAIFCDKDPDPSVPWGEASFTVDVVGDQPRPAWEWVILFCSAGRATPVMRNGKISVVYQYRDAHSDAGVSVPAKTSTQLITSGNCENVAVKWLSKDGRPTIFQFQFLDELKNWEQDVLPVEDDGGSLNDPSQVGKETYKPEAIQAYGVTRGSQLFREGLWRHRINRLVRRELTFTTGPWALAAEVGDLIDFEHEVMRPFATDVPVAMQVTVFTDTTHVTIDHALTGSGLQFVGRDPDGKPAKSNITSYVNTGNTSALVLATAVTVKVGAACVVGKVDKLVETYEIVAITLREDLKREVRAFQWTPTAYDPIPLTLWTTGEDTVLEEQDLDQMPPRVFGISVAKTIEPGHRISWARPASKEGTPARIYLRELGINTWQLLATTEESSIVTKVLAPARTYEVSICLENSQGDIVQPEQGDLLTFVPEEFPPLGMPKLTNVRSALVDDFLLVEADELQQNDVAYFELSIGTSWAARQILARERFPRILTPNPPLRVPLMVAARSTSGIYGEVVSLANPGWEPPFVEVVIPQTDPVDPGPSGTHTSTEWNSTLDVIELVAGAFSGNFVSAEQDAGYQARFWWQVICDRIELEDVPVGELAFPIGSGEAFWRTIEGRPASPMVPGIDWQTRVSDFAIPISDVPPTMLVAGHVGEVGTHSVVLIETRFEVDGAWTAYKPHVDRYVVARKMQVRLTFGRQDLRYHPRAKLLSYKAAL